MKYKILHLPSATFMYRHLYKEQKEAHDFFDTEWEYHQTKLLLSGEAENFSPFFSSREEAQGFINSWFVYFSTYPEEPPIDFFRFDDEDTNFGFLLEHFEIMEYPNV
jgi:hypothetical protein